MAQLNDTQLLAFFEQYLPNNETELITPSVLRLALAQLVESKASLETLTKFATLAGPRFTGTPQVPTAPTGTNSDQVASTAFVQATLLAIASGKNLSELVVPQDVQAANWYLTSNGFWEARRSFRAVADPVSGPNWRLLAGFAGQLTTLPVANLSDATDVGRAMLTAPSAAVQRGLVNNPQIRAGQYGNHPGFNTEDGPAGSWAWVIKAILALSSGPILPVVAKPVAPTAGQVDDIGDIFSFLPSVDSPSFASHKIAGLPGTTGAEWLNTANSYVQNGRICVRVSGAVPAGGLAVYVGASGIVPDGQVLTNADPFTANNVAPTVPGALQVTFVVDNASLSPGDTLGFTAKVSGGTAPYQHSVQALNPDTGTITVLGTASTAGYSGTWPKVPAGVYLVTDAVSDAAGGSLVSAARRVVVAAPGAGGGVPLVPATRTRLGGLRVSDGLSITEDGSLSTDVQLEKENTWVEPQTFEKGIKFNNGFIDDAGHGNFRQLEVGQKHFTFGRYYSLSKDSIIQWKPDEYIGQDGDGDVGLARVGPGVLEVNTGTAGQAATLSVLDVLVSSVQNLTLNTFSKLAAFVANLGLRAGATTTTDPAAPTSWIGNRASLRTTDKTSVVNALNELVGEITFAGLSLVKNGNVIGLQQSVANIPLPAFENVGLISDTDGTLIIDNDFAKGYRYSPFIALDPAGGPLTFAGGRSDFGAFYDKNFVFKRKINDINFDANSYEAGICYMRLSFSAKVYPTQTYSLGSLGYVRALRRADGTLLKPDQAGQVDISSLAGAGGGSYDDSAIKKRVSDLEALGGRQRGPWVAKTDYKQFDMVQQSGLQYYANSTFTSGASFTASNWTALPGGGGGGSVTAITQDYYGPGSPPWPLVSLDDMLQWNTSRRAYIPAAILAQNLLPPLTDGAWEVAQEQVGANVKFLPDGAISIEPQGSGGNGFGLRFQCNNNSFRDKIKDNTNYNLWVVARITSPGATLDVQTEARGEGYHSLATGLAPVGLQQYYTLQLFAMTTANYNAAANDNMLPSFFLGQSYPNVTVIKHVLLLPA